MTDNFWKDKYPVGIAAEIDADQYPNIQAVLKESCQRFADKPALSNMGKTLTYGELYELSGVFAAYLQNHTDLKAGDRIAVQLPTVLQYPVVVFGALRAGMIVVNTNPLYTAREMEHQFNDSGAKALVCLANMAHLAEEVLPKTGIKHVIVTEVGDLLPPLKRLLVNTVVKHVKRMVPAFNLPQAVKLTKALALGRGKPVSEASLGLVHESSGADAATSDCSYIMADGSRGSVMLRWSPINDNTQGAIDTARNSMKETAAIAIIRIGR